MTDQELEALYKANLPSSHAAALRGVFDAGFACGVADQADSNTTMLASPDPSTDESASDVVVPTIKTP